MKTSDFYYELPERLIAQTPLERRDSSRLLHLDKRSGQVEHRHFYDLPEFLHEGDCLVLNDSRVLPARLFGKRESGGAVEVVLLPFLRPYLPRALGAAADPIRRAFDPVFSAILKEAV